MIIITCRDALYTYDMYHITKAFFPNEEIQQQVNPEQELVAKLDHGSSSCFCVAENEVETIEEKRKKKHYVNQKLYRYLVGVSGHEMAWGILTGIRPTKMMMRRLDSGKSKEEALAWMREEYLVSEQKANLSLEIAGREKKLLSQLDYQDGYSLYVGIPFCPTICSYCSFSSSAIGVWKDRVDSYLDALLKELSYIGAVSGEKKLNTIYVGGGTPTTLTPEQLDRLLSHLQKTFSYEDLKEFTVEAGRPDSITREKLEVLRRHPVTRISINPQSMQQKTLDGIGRFHSVAAVVDAFEMARKLGFDNINMDLIAGLPGERVADMEDTLQQIEALMPDSLTIHSLAIKRAAKMGQEKSQMTNRKRQQEKQENVQNETVPQIQSDPARTKEEDAESKSSSLEQMIDLGEEYARKMGLVPYYLYRQKNIAGNFENVGYAKVDKAGIYNILIMEEKQSIIAAGAGASTKIVLPHKVSCGRNGKETNIIRIENVKDISEYIRRVDEMIERKGEWLWH
ncbi:MAG: coproporphyrinogen dehydrogenase HemZ [Hespellia sp.]|nr:coproporphyrinogen dehydrogenase HemZ [Hespellia sp.]